MIGTEKCLREHFLVFVAGYHWIVQLQLVGHMDISQYAAVQLIECGPMMGTVRCLLKQLVVFVTGHRWIVRLQLVGTWTSHSMPQCNSWSVARVSPVLVVLHNYVDGPLG